jgi:hypothetical protein
VYSDGGYTVDSKGDSNLFPYIEIANNGIFSPVPNPDNSTRIVSFTPSDGFVATTSAATTTVDFSLHAFISAADIGNFLTIKIIYRNIDQNTLLNAPCSGLDPVGTCSVYSFDLFRGQATTSGDFYISSTTVLARGNYRVEASLDTATKLGNVNLGAFTFLGATSKVQNHQFIVGSSTFIGNLSQNTFREVDSFFGTLPATSTSALAAQCNPLSAIFGIRECMAFLLIPDAGQLNDAMNNIRVGILQKMPFGYLTRIITLLGSNGTTTLPVISYTFQSDSPLSGDTITFDTGSYMNQAAALVAEAKSNIAGDQKTVWEIFQPLIDLIIYLVLVYAMIHDVSGIKLTHKDN